MPSLPRMRRHRREHARAWGCRPSLHGLPSLRRHWARGAERRHGPAHRHRLGAAVIRSLRIAVPSRHLDMFAVSADTMPTVMETVEVELEDYRPIVTYLNALRLDCDRENVRVSGVILGARPYLSLREHLRERATWSTRSEDGCIVFMDMRIFMDPMRDDGEPVPLFVEEEAVNLFAMRKRPPGAGP